MNKKGIFLGHPVELKKRSWKEVIELFIFSPAYRRNLETGVSVTDDDDDDFTH